jgi:hypothetical protein
MKRNNIYIVSSSTLAKIQNIGTNICPKCHKNIELRDEVVSKISGCNHNRHAIIYHIKCAKELNIIE